MGRLRVISGRELCRILNSTDSPRFDAESRTSEGTTTVPVPDHGEFAIGTLLSIVRQSRLPRVAFESPE